MVASARLRAGRAVLGSIPGCGCFSFLDPGGFGDYTRPGGVETRRCKELPPTIALIGNSIIVSQIDMSTVFFLFEFADGFLGDYTRPGGGDVTSLRMFADVSSS